RYRVSRVPVRRALEELRGQGLVESRPGAGWFLSGTSFHQPLALGSFRHAASAVTASGRSLVRRVLDFGYQAAPGPIAGALEVADDPQVLAVRSLRLVEGPGGAGGEPLDLVQEWVPAVLADRVSRADAEHLGIWATLQQQGHRVDAVRQTISAGLATPADAEVLGVAAGSALLLVRRVAHDPDGRPLALSDHRYLAHRFSLEVEFRGWPSGQSDATPGLRSVPDIAVPEPSPLEEISS
ncbi:MAG: GntR family transcriptional regulator, partial [Ornithinibacter sp.]